ncbi:MAG: deoxyribose-phosphate aldolase [Candidatus Gastranaerophilales bacterium]|nr:deoxyribose-phosphate aldolase [Candidatus Gastranaerophilales bacterium]
MENINKYIEHTILKPNASTIDVEKVIKEALEYDFFGVCVNPNYVKFAHDNLSKSNVKVVTVVNFPLANNTSDMTKYQIERVLEYGADEIDTVINISALKNKDYKQVEADLIVTRRACANHNLKVILETDLLTKEEIKLACEIAVSAGANFVKTSTGFVKNGIGAQIEDVKLMYETVSPYGLNVKASGGIKNYKQAIDLINAGAVRLGTSSGVEIMKGTENV